MATQTEHGHDHDYGHSHAALEMRDVAIKFLDSLSADQKAQVTFDYIDGERLFWYYPPLHRHGLLLREMDESQRLLANALMATGLARNPTSGPGPS